VDVTIVIGTFGGQEWIDLAEQRAIPSAEAQGVPVVHRHAETLAEARNSAIDACSSEFVIHLDADDVLERRYVREMARGSADVRVPAVRRYAEGKRRGGTYMPRVYGHRHKCSGDCLPDGNWVTLGACVRMELAKKVRWAEWPIYEDFAFWLECWKAGATFEALPRAIYGYHWMPNSRNHALEDRDVWHHKIVDSIMGAPA
jgi:glycosyltransferase involved in cell wall biosynthesis